MLHSTIHRSPSPRRLLITAGAFAIATALVAGCTSNEPASSDDEGEQQAAGSSNDEMGEEVTIAWSGPEADHGWLAAINSSALDEAEKYDDINLRAAEGTNDASLQIQQVETFINEGVDAIVLLPTDGAALTDIAMEAMDAGIPVVNVDREFSSPFAARTTILGDNYGMGVSAGTYACQLIEEHDIDDPVIAEIAGIDALPLTQDRSDGFAEALSNCGEEVDNRVAAEFTVESGEAEASNLLQAAPEIDIIWNHDDDQGVGVKAAFDNAGRDEFFFIGGAGSCNAMRWIEDGEMEATVLYPPTQAADGIRLARLIAQGKGMSDLVQVAVPRRIVLDAPVVTADNVDQHMERCFES
ncbi:sugar ABC transporter substrate-binding protein [Actinobacteria bacterium YIM 96077]|uniref:Sugar ABC transporter substrate-binding protein n=1 Tax=Phytoactinopolyspora halophila TaxID=1981511 RepID=A0A329QFF0_9ACTN|nr:substrate-binding domain-containing protein [Phytoactinopolyspora halophila]AYY13111.1 sugar ABC transporter substrate-binding protein [Actinobacteria bacterium YIM 96077]RAW11175.1 sugar ABC transporter substrate-binding protein [Phytoactinopolyspora halophila]